MAGLQHLEAEKAARWAKAQRYAQGYADNGMSWALTVYYTRYFPLIVLAAYGTATVIAFLRAGNEPVEWTWIGWIGTLLFAVGAAIGGLTYNSKRLTPTVELGSTLSIVMPLENDEQRALNRGINGKQPVPDEHLTIARAMAVQSRKTTATWLLIGPSYAVFLANAFSSPSMLSSLGWFYLLMLALMITMLILGIRAFRRQGHFLATTTPPSTAEQT